MDTIDNSNNMTKDKESLSFANAFQNVLDSDIVSNSNNHDLLIKYISVYYLLLEKHGNGITITNALDICQSDLLYKCFLIWIKNMNLNNSIEINNIGILILPFSKNSLCDIRKIQFYINY